MASVEKDYWGCSFLVQHFIRGNELVTDLCPNLALACLSLAFESLEKRPKSSDFQIKLYILLFIDFRCRLFEKATISVRKKNMLLRRATSIELPNIKRVFHSSVLAVDRGYYTELEIEDWASCGDDADKWRKKIEEQLFFVAQDKDNQIVGFVSMAQKGYLDLLYMSQG